MSNEQKKQLFGLNPNNSPRSGDNFPLLNDRINAIMYPGANKPWVISIDGSDEDQIVVLKGNVADNESLLKELTKKAFREQMHPSDWFEQGRISVVDKALFESCDSISNGLPISQVEHEEAQWTEYMPPHLQKRKPSKEGNYIVQAGDNLWSLAKKFNTTVDELAKLNNIDEANRGNIYAGEKLYVPEIEMEQDPLKRKGTIYIQVLLDKKGKPVVDEEIMNSIKKRIEAKGKDLNVAWKVNVTYAYYDNIMSREKFENRQGADDADSYILVGNGKELDAFVNKNREEKLGWENPYDEWPSSVNGTSTDKLHYINMDNIKSFNGKFPNEPAFSSMEEKLYLMILHEDGHPKFRNYKKNVGKAGYSGSPIGHVGGTIMAYPMYKSDKYDIYDKEMIKMLQRRHGELEDNKKNNAQ